MDSAYAGGSDPAPDHVAAVRRFNRFYTRQIGLLEEGLLHSGFTLTEARILYELAERGSASATEIGGDLGLDAGYLSRIVKRFRTRGLLERRTDPDDARRSLLSLTPAGEAAFRPLEAASKAQAGAMIAPLRPAAQSRLASAMAIVETLLTPSADDRPFTLRPHRVGELGLVASRQALIYHREHGWDGSYEALAAEILAGFARTFDAGRERSFVADMAGAMAGAAFVMRKSDTVAQLRLLHVEPEARGLGVGAALVEACIAFARQAGYATLMLWTNDVLTAARRIYVAKGFRLTGEERHHSFGRDLVGQTWELAL